MKKIKIFLGAICIIALSFTACQTDAVTETPEEQQVDFETSERATAASITTVQHNYDYYGERFSVKYVVNNDSGAILETSGDVDRAQSYLSSDRVEAVLFTNLDDIGPRLSSDAAIADFVSLDVQLFNSLAEMESQVERSAGSAIPDTANAVATGAEGPCISVSAFGFGDFYFFKHAYYSTEMTSLRRLDRRYFLNHWVGSTHNDEMSSLAVFKPANRNSYTVLHKHSCFNGKSLAFYQGPGPVGLGVPNLSWFGLGWFGNWNDEVSSVYGYSW